MNTAQKEWDIYKWARCIWPSQKIILWLHDNNLNYPFGNPIRNPHFFMDPYTTIVCVSRSHSIRIQKLLSHIYKIGYAQQNMHITCTYIYNVLYDVPTFVETTKSKHIIYASSLGKGVIEVVNLFCRYQMKYKDFNTHLLICTPGYEYNSEWPSRLIDAIRHTKNILFMGAISKDTLYRFISTSCVIITPPFWETFGCVFAEACFLGTHVLVSSKSGAVYEIVGESNIVNYATDESLVRLSYLIENPYENLPSLPDEMYTNACFHKWNTLLRLPLQITSFEDESQSCFRLCTCI
jgi:hypothetical protein